MAKTLLHHYPPGQFAPVIFESRQTVGGLWAVTAPNEKQTSFIDAEMRTNLSRFTVCFSDFSWELNVGVDADDMFPRAVQVNEYLDKYAARYIPDSVLRLGCRVLNTRRNSDGWTVKWGNDKDVQEEETFDYLVVASGYFSSPNIPSIRGLDSFPPERVIHSSSLASAKGRLLTEPTNLPGKLIVVGGSMSGAEAASSLALASSSSSNIQVHHLATRPFWAVPTYLPDSSSSSGSFLPLDIVMYDLARRPPGDIQYSLNPTMPPERALLVHKYFSTILGSDQSDVARFSHDGDDDLDQRPPWVAVTDHYAEFVRAGDITTSLGRVEAVNWPAGCDRGTVQVRESSGSTTTTRRTIEDVAGIVLATGFTPFNALGFLPDDVLAALEYAPDDPVFPLVLDEKATFHPAVPDLGFVGMYRGPYWGVMEMQARSLAQQWDRQDTNSSLQMINPRLSLSSSSSSRRAQFPMGDYVGLIETFARELGIQRSSLFGTETGKNERTGPAVPVRYSVQTTTNKAEIAATHSALSDLLRPDEPQQHALSEAVFRALHGSWRVEQQLGEALLFSGSATFRPRAVSSSSSAGIEYLYHEDLNKNSCDAVFSISENFIHIINQPDTLSRHIEFVAIHPDQAQDGEYQYRHSARGIFSDRLQKETCDYVFHIKGVQIVSWQETIISPSEEKQIKTYTRFPSYK
jgi:cation diffusion facilitator CzcD-associated flavoprotein CzcO